MKLKPLIDSLEGVPEPFHQYYTKRADGKYVLELDGIPPGLAEATKVDEFRTKNIELMRLNDELKTRALTPEELESYNKLKKEQEDNKDKKLISEGKIEELVAQRTERMRNTYEAQIAALTTAQDDLKKKLDAATGHLSAVVIDSEVSKAVTSVGQVRQGAMTDILGRAKMVWRLGEDGKPLAMKGDQPLYAADGRTPLSFQEWATSLVSEAPYLFEGSSGGGSGNEGKGGGGGGGTKVIDKGDTAAFAANLADIASGKVLVR